MKDKRTAPCKGCDERYPKCHSTCERYIEWGKNRKKKSEAEIKEILLNEYEHDRALRIRDWRERGK